MLLHFIHVTPSAINTYYLNEADSLSIRSSCAQAGKLWANELLGFFINSSAPQHYAAVIVRGEDRVVECMEYKDVDTNKPEFTIDESLLSHLETLTANTTISLDKLDGFLNHIINAPTRARRWDIYPQISELFPSMH